MTESPIERLLETRPEEFARHLLRQHGLPNWPLRANHGWSNQVWLAPAHVVRLSSGRFHGSFAHERDIIQRLPPEVPHAPICGYGRVGHHEWLIQYRAPGIPLSAAWPTLNREQRHTAIRQLGAILRALHETPIPDSFDNPSLAAAIGPGGERRNAYHLTPEHYTILLDACLAAPGSDRDLIERCGGFIAERLELFADDRRVLVHCDLHFENLLWDEDRLTAVLDFEGARPAAADAELETLLRFAREPWLYQPPGSALIGVSTTLRDLPAWLAENYPALFEQRHLAARQSVYEALWWLVQLLNYPPGAGPPDPRRYLKVLLDAGNGWKPW